jgi:prevent-host-death family protein
MKNVNVATLKNKLSAYLDEVEQGEEILVINRRKAVARVVPVEPSSATEEEWQLVVDGKLRLPVTRMSNVFLDRFLAARMPKVSKGTSVDALIRDRGED